MGIEATHDIFKMAEDKQKQLAEMQEADQMMSDDDDDFDTSVEADLWNMEDDNIEVDNFGEYDEHFGDQEESKSNKSVLGSENRELSGGSAN